MRHRYLVAFELDLMGTGKFFEGILIVENTSTGAHRSLTHQPLCYSIVMKDGFL